MKNEKLKTSESQNSIKGKSTFENSKISDRTKPGKNSLKPNENQKPTKAKKIVIIQRTSRLEKNKPKEKVETRKVKDEKFKKVINKTKIAKTIFRTKKPNKILTKTNDKSGKTPSLPVKKNKIDKSLLTMSSLPRIKEKDSFNTKLKNKNKRTNNNITTYKEPFLTIQHTYKDKKNFNLKQSKKTTKKTEEEKYNSSEELDNISMDIAPKIITDNMYKKDSKPPNKNNNIKNSIRNKIISLSKNKNKKNFFNEINNNIKLNQTLQTNYRNNKLNSSCYNRYKDSTIKKSLNYSTDKSNSVYSRKKTRNKNNTSYLKTETNRNIKNNKENKDNKINKIPKAGFNNCNYLKYTVSALNKIVKKKKEQNNTNNISMSSRPVGDKKTKFIKKKEKTNKLKSILILRNTISRYKLYKKDDLIFDDKSIKQYPNSPTLTRYSTLRNSKKNCFNSIDNYTMIKSLGKGSYGEVKLAIDKISRKKYAIKIYPKNIMDDQKKRKNIENEINILKQLDNTNIMKLYEVIKTPAFQYLIMEYIEGISLLKIIKKESKHYLEEKRALKIFHQVVKAIEYCQKKDICHRDIKLENILTIKNDVIKLIDFGFAVKTNKETYQTLLCGSPSYMAPEIVKKEKYIAQYSDIWSLGVLLYSMLFGRFPFIGKSQKELFDNIKKCEVDFPKDIIVNEKIYILLKKIFVITPTQRPSLSEILNDISNVIGN